MPLIIVVKDMAKVVKGPLLANANSMPTFRYRFTREGNNSSQ